MAQGKNIAGTVRALAEPVAAALDLRVWDVRYEKEGASWFLRIDIDKDGGVAIEDCERMSRAIDPILDEHDPIGGAYYLEVSSPGLERELTRPEHFELMEGEPVKLRLIRPRDGLRDFSGVLLGLKDGAVQVETEGGPQAFDRKEIAYIRLDDFENPYS